ncbi:MAG: hypothetical protein MK008_02375 [Bdellovibrionales bacterium]|nr:hypothetical protein [Bdellovibrionales bacterium]
MLKKALSLTFIVGMLTLHTACSDKSSSKSNTLDTNKVLNQKISQKEKSQRLSDMATELLTDESFMYANNVAKKSLLLDSDNKQAELVVLLTNPVMLVEGFFGRITPIADQFSWDSSRENYSYSQDIERRKKLRTQTTAGMFFLESNKADIENEQDVQKFIDQLISGLEDLRKFFKTNKNNELNIKLPAALIVEDVNEKLNQCDWTEIKDGVYQNSCDIYESTNVKLARVDQEIIQHTLAAYILSLSISNAYNLDGLINALAVYQDLEGGVIKDSLIRQLIVMNDNNFGQLRNPKALQIISELGLDAIAGMNWLKKTQKICTENKDEEPKRKGYMFTDPICIDRSNKEEVAKFDKMVALIEDGLSGKKLQIETKNLNNIVEAPKVYKTTVNPSAFINGQVNDLKSLGINFNRCNAIESVDDVYMDGVFPQGDVNLLIKMRKHSCGQ